MPERFEWPDEQAEAWTEEWEARYHATAAVLDPPGRLKFPFLGPTNKLPFFGLPAMSIRHIRQMATHKLGSLIRQLHPIPRQIHVPSFTPDGNATLVFTVPRRDGQYPGGTVWDIVLSDIVPTKEQTE